MSQFKLVIAGYYGMGNLGDDTLLWGFLSQLKSQEFEVTVLSGDPEFTSFIFGIQSVPRKKMSQIKQAIKNCDALVFAGGSIFQDTTSIRSVAYYAHLIYLAKSFKKKVILLGQGIGPLKTWLGKKMASRALNKADAIVLRDLESLERIKELYIDAPTGLAADLAYLIEPQITNFRTLKQDQTDIVGLIPRFLKKDNNKKLIEFFAHLSDLLSEHGLKPKLISMQPNEEMYFIRQIETACKYKHELAQEIKTPQDLLNEFAQLDSMITMRLHGGIIATLFDIQPFMLSYDPKVNALSKSLGLPCEEIYNAEANNIFNKFLKFNENTIFVNPDFEKKRNQLLLQSKSNISILIKNL